MEEDYWDIYETVKDIMSCHGITDHDIIHTKTLEIYNYRHANDDNSRHQHLSDNEGI